MIKIKNSVFFPYILITINNKEIQNTNSNLDFKFQRIKEFGDEQKRQFSNLISFVMKKKQ